MAVPHSLNRVMYIGTISWHHFSPMDIVTQGLLGAVTAQADPQAGEIQVAAGVGFGVAPLCEKLMTASRRIVNLAG